VFVKDANGKKHEVVTGDDGTYHVEKVAPGHATVTVESPDGTREEKVLIESSELARLSDAACHPPAPPPSPVGAIDGCACDAAQGVWVNAGTASVVTAGGAIYSASTDAAGCFLLENVPVGAQQVQIEKGAFVQQFEVTVIENQTVAVPTPATCEAVVPSDVGSIAGRVCAGDGVTWLGDADIYVVRGDGTRVATSSDIDGRYQLDNVPVGTQTLNIEKGSFHDTRPVTVNAGETTVVPDDECALQTLNIQVAVVEGDWDVVEDVLASLGIEGANVVLFDGTWGNNAWVAELVENYETLSSFDVVFFNCGVADQDWAIDRNQIAIDNLRAFVAAGGSVYASDWAYDIVEQTWPDYIDFEAADGTGNDAQRGVDQDTIPGDIIDPGLAAAMGQDTLNMDYPLGRWAVMTAVASGVTVYVRGDARVCGGIATCFTQQDRLNVPHTVGFSPGAGRVLYTSFHQEPGINLDQERILQLLMFEL
jgi:hypothetical protein